MTFIKDILVKYSLKIDPLDLELLIACVLGKPREFVLAHPEYNLTRNQELGIRNYAKRRIKDDPLAYILGEKEFYGLRFKVNKNVLVPRPETEQIVELATQNLKRKNKKALIIDVGTGSGNIIIAIAKQLQNQELGIKNCYFFGIDISNKALIIAKKNARNHKVFDKIKFIKGDLLNPIIHNSKFLPRRQAGIIPNSRMIILANLPYLSPAVYRSSQISAQMYEPKMAILSHNKGLDHYTKLLKQIKLLVTGCGLPVTGFFEISPEQKSALQKLIKKYFPRAKVKFYKDLSSKWRVCEIKIRP